MSSMHAVIGDYRLTARIDEGGMGAVFRAQHVSLGHEVAIKLLPTTLASDATAQQWFRRGAASAAALQHPNILPVYHYGEHEGAPYLVMPFIAGGTLKDRLLRGPLDFAQIVHVMQQLAAALDFAHSQGVVHRDVKPANLLLDERGTLYLADFGIAKALESATRFTRTGTTIGTPEYMAPEQARGQADHRADLYAAGIILYQLLTGRVPFTGDSAVEILMQHIQDPLPLEPVRAVRPSLPAAIESVVSRALAKHPDARYQRGADLVADLSAALSGASERPNAWLPDNQQTIIASNTGGTVPASHTLASRAELGTTPVPYALPMATPVPHLVPAAPSNVPYPQAQSADRPTSRNPLVIGLSVALAATLLLSSAIGVGAWAANRPESLTSTKVVAQVTPTATVTPTSTPQPTSTATATPTLAPTSTPQPTATPVAVGPAPRGTQPAGWKTYIGTTDAPFALYYPGDWTIDDSSLESDGLVRFISPDRKALMIVQFLGPISTANANIDVLRNNDKQYLLKSCSGTCTLSNEETTTDVIDGLNFGVYDIDVTYNADKSTYRHRRATGFGWNNGTPYSWYYNFISTPSTFVSNWNATWKAMLFSTDFAFPR
jgi:serine/threonine protein kinase